jgi:hypothetical protein
MPLFLTAPWKCNIPVHMFSAKETGVAIQI